MKKLCVLLAVMLMLVLIWPAAALAEGKTGGEPAATQPVSSDSADTKPAEAVSLQIDNANVYDGMDRAYQDGYTPTVNNGTATIILPLVASGNIAGNTITVTPNLGEPASSPFVFKNYQKTVNLNSNAVNGGSAAVPSYLIRFDLPLASERFNGVYPVTIDVQAKAADNSPIQQSFTCYVTITDGKDPNATEPTPEPEVEEPTSQPKMIVSGYSVNPSPVMAGEEFTVTVTLKNTSESKSVQNMTVTASRDSPNLALQNDSDTFYIGKLGKGNTTEIELKYKTDLETPAQRYNIMLAIGYDNTDATPLTSTGTVAVQVNQPLRVEMETPQIAAQVNAGDTLPITFQVMNLGRSMVYNVRALLAAPGLIPSGTAFIGNMEAGTAMPGEMDVFIGTKDMTEGYEGEDKYGLTNGVITLIYEDASGQQYTAETEFSTTINAPVIAQTSSEPEEEPEKAGQWWISILIGAVIAAGLAAFLIVRGKRRVKNDEMG
jgi:hypothetical protein